MLWLLRYGQKKIDTFKVVPKVDAIILQNNQSKSWYGLQWYNEAVIYRYCIVLYCIVLYGTASEDAYESGLRSIGAMVVKIWPKEDRYIQGGSKGGCNNTTKQPKQVLVWLAMEQ